MILITSMLASFFVYQWEKSGFLYAFALAVFVEMLFLMCLSFILQKHENRVKEAKMNLTNEKRNGAEMERNISALNQTIDDLKRELKETQIALNDQRSKFSEYEMQEKRYKETISQMKEENKTMTREIATYKHRLGIDE